MAGKTLTVTLDAKDQLSAVFRKVGDSSKEMGDALEQAGTDGKRGLDDITGSAAETVEALDRTSDSTRTFGDRVQSAAGILDDFGQGLTVVGAGLVYAGNQAMENERQIIALESAYGDAAAQMIQFSEDLSDSLSGIFTDEDVRRGALYFATLRNEYGLSIDQIEELMQRTADLAALRGISFEDASSRITSAIRGETEAAEYLNLTLNQQSIDREGVTLSMTNQEAAQFRLNATLEQSARYQGTAQEIAESSIGTYASVTDQLQDMSVTVGNIIGPWGSMVTGFGTAAIGISGTVGAFSKLTVAMRSSALAATALSVATTPLTWWITGGVALGAAAYAVWDSFEEGESVTSRLADAVDSLHAEGAIGFFKTLALGADEATASVSTFTRAIFEMWNEAAQQEALGNDALAEHLEMLATSTYQVERLAQEYVNSGRVRTDALNENMVTGEQVADIEARLREEFTLTNNEIIARGEALDAIAAAYLDPTVNANELRGKIDELNQSYLDGDITLDEHTEALARIATQYGHLDTAVQAANATVSDSALILRDLLGIEDEAATVTEEIQQIIDMVGSFEEAIDGTGTRVADAITPGIEAMLRLSELGSNMSGGVGEFFDQAAESAAEFQEQTISLSESVVATTREYVEEQRQLREEFIATGMALAGWDNALSQINLTSLATDSSLLADNLTRAGAALDNVFRAIVGNTNAIAGQVQGVEDWALELINVEGEYGKIDDLLADGVITLETYNQAQQAQVEISRANASVQEDILAIQAQQAPFIADMTEAQAAYVDELSRAPEEQQRLALAWMDTNTAAQAHEGILLANSVAIGEWGAQGEGAFEGFIRGAVQANPLLFDIWESVGLISGTPMDFTVDTDGLEGAQSELGMLVDSLDHLTQVLAQIFGIDIEVNGEEDVQSLADSIERIAGERHNVNVDADANPALDMLRAVEDRVITLDGTTATTTAVGVDDASDEMNSVESLRLAIDGNTALVTALGEDDASDEINAVRNNLQDLAGDTATVTINAINNAGAALASVANQLAALDGRSATSYVNTVYSTSGGGGGGNVTYAHGGVVGVPAFAGGGMVPFWAGENGPEIAHFAGGGTALLPYEGMYAAPPMTYISPANANTNNYGGDVNVTVIVQGSVTTERELTEHITHEFSQALTQELIRHRRAHGMWDG